MFLTFHMKFQKGVQLIQLPLCHVMDRGTFPIDHLPHIGSLTRTRYPDPSAYEGWLALQAKVI